MNPTLRALALGTFVAAIGAGALFAFPAPEPDGETESWDVFELRRRMAAAEEDGRRIEREEELLRRRLAMKQVIIGELLADRLTFDEAASRFAEVNGLQPSAIGYLRLTYPGESDEERAAWQLARHLRGSCDPRARALGDKWECLRTARE
jgi:hypothetical protein